MLISIEKKITLLAMTKTGSSSVEHALAPYCDIAYYGNSRTKYISYRRYSRFVVPYLNSLGFENMETTCLIREPISWLFSWYRYRARPEIAGRRNSTADISFEEFATIYLTQTSKGPGIGRPSKFLADRDGKPAVDYVFKYENMPMFTRFLEERFQTTLDIPQLNASLERKFELSEHCQSRLQAFFAPEYEIYESAIG